jgi:hypothetical protein
VPYSDFPPVRVFPDTPEGRRDAYVSVQRTHPNLTIAFCGDFRPDQFDASHCERANWGGNRSHNWCYRCPCGYMRIALHVKDAATPRGRPMTTTGF